MSGENSIIPTNCIHIIKFDLPSPFGDQNRSPVGPQAGKDLKPAERRGKRCNPISPRSRTPTGTSGPPTSSPFCYIKDKLGNPSPLRALDIGCGAGRYNVLLMERLPIRSLTCADANLDMLEEAKRHLAENGFTDFEALVSRVEDLSIKEGSLDCIFTFNAVHHFDFKTFLRKSKAFLTTGGRVFIYTRLPSRTK